MEVVVTTGAVRRANLQANKQHPTFLRPDALADARATVSKHWREALPMLIVENGLMAWKAMSGMVSITYFKLGRLSVVYFQ